MTLADLATHTAGLPGLPPGFWRYALLSPRDPYARYPVRRLARAARSSLAVPAGQHPYAYSNYGYGLLGYLLGQAAGQSYPALVTERICRPLGLNDTAFEVPPAARDRMARGHRRGRPVPAWHLGALAAAGGLRSTAADLGRLLRACLSPGQTPLAGAIASALEFRRAISPAPAPGVPGPEIGLAWHCAWTGGERVIWHNGMTGGFSAMVAFAPSRRLGLAALANSGGAPPSPLDQAVLAALGAPAG